MQRDYKKPTTSGHVFRKIHRGSGAQRFITDILDKADTGTGRTAQTLSGMLERFNMDLEMTCGKCDHIWTPPFAELVERFGPDALLSDVKIVCPSCGADKTSSHPVARRVV